MVINNGMDLNGNGDNGVAAGMYSEELFCGSKEYMKLYGNVRKLNDSTEDDS